MSGALIVKLCSRAAQTQRLRLFKRYQGLKSEEKMVQGSV